MLIVELKAQLGFIGGKTKDPIRVDTLCYPLKDGLQLIIVNLRKRAILYNQRISFEYSTMSSLPPYGAMPDNIYLFRNASGKIIKAFNIDIELDTLTAHFATIKTNTKQNDITNNQALFGLGNGESDYVNDKYWVVYKEQGLHPTSRYTGESLPKQKENDAGLIDRRGEQVIPYMYADLIPIKDNFFAFRKGKVGVINTQNEVIAPLLFDDYRHEGDHLYTFWLDKKCQGIYEATKGAFKILEGYEEIQHISHLNKYPYMQVKKKGKYGLMNKDFELVIPAIYEDLRNYSQGYCKVKKDSFYGFLDTNNQVMIPVKYPTLGAIFMNERVWYTNAEGQYGFLDRKGNVIISAQYEEVVPFYITKAAVKKNGKWAFIDSGGQLLTPFKYQYISYDHGAYYRKGEQFIVFEGPNKGGVLNQQLEVVVPLEYRSVYYRDESNGRKKEYWEATTIKDKEHHYTKEGKRIK